MKMKRTSIRLHLIKGLPLLTEEYERLRPRAVAALRAKMELTLPSSQTLELSDTARAAPPSACAWRDIAALTHVIGDTETCGQALVKVAGTVADDAENGDGVLLHAAAVHAVRCCPNQQAEH